MRVAVTGAQGYIGHRTVRTLRQAGFEVVRFTRNPSEPGDVAFKLGEPVEPRSLAGVSALVHGAYEFGLDRDGVERVNVGGTVRLLEAAKAAGVGRIVLVSTVAAFDGCSSVYGRGKLVAEKLVLDAGGAALRLGLVWGEPGRGMFGALAKMGRLPLLPLFGGGHQKMVLVHVDDAAAAIVAAVKDPSLKGVLTVAHREPMEFRDILRKAAGPVRTVSVPWWLGVYPLRGLEALGLRLRFRADNLVSLLHVCPSLDFSQTDRLGVAYRPFA